MNARAARRPPRSEIPSSIRRSSRSRRKIKQRILEAQAESLESRGQRNALSYGFPVNFFDDPRATLALVGVVNRLDRSFRPPRIKGARREDFCGEVRFIYRFGYVEARAGAQYASRLPLTLNVVMRSKTTGDAAFLRRDRAELDPVRVRSTGELRCR